jgi:hypothetical protein
MLSLSVMTWVRFLVWLDLGMLIYWFYGRTHSPLVDPVEAASRTAGEGFANLMKITGFLLLFNGGAITVLGLLTEWGVTNEGLAKWHELDLLLNRVGLHINPEIADRFGLTIVGIALVVIALGWVLGKSTRKPQAV